MVKIHAKPMNKKEWEFWNEILSNFIEEFESLVSITPEELLARGDGMTDPFEAHNIGVVKGMWAVHKFMEERMVRGDEEPKVDYELPEKKEKVKDKRGSKEHRDKIRKGMKLSWKQRKKSVKKDSRKRPMSKEHRDKIGKGVSLAWKHTKRTGMIVTDKHMERIKEGIQRYWREKRKELKNKGKKPYVVVHRELKKKGRGKPGFSTGEIFDLLTSLGKKRKVGYKELWKALEKNGRVPRKNTQKYKKMLSDRLFYLTREGKVTATKKGLKKLYKVA